MENLENSLVAGYFPLAYLLSKMGRSFRDRVIAAMKAQGLTKAELHRRSGVPYHALDKFLKREGASTSADNARALARALGISVDDDGTYDELRSLFFRLNEEQRAFLLKSIRGLLGD